MSEFIIAIVLYSHCVLRPYLIKDENIGEQKWKRKKLTKSLLAFENITVDMTALFY